MSTITIVGAGTTSTAVNGSVTPTPHASTTVGDLVLIQASIRNSGVGDVNVPAGWTSLLYSGHHRFLARFWEAGDTAPVITFGAGVAGADTIGQPVTFRGVSRETLTAPAAGAGQLNGSAANIALPALTVPHDRHLVIAAAWKQDDLSTISAPAGFTSINTVSVTAGDDAAQAWWYLIQTTAANIASGTLTVTGGAAAISRAFVLALKPAPSVTVTEQDVYPPRVLVSVTDLTLGDSVELYRSVAGTRTPVRAGSSAAVDDPSFLVIDAELPFGVPVAYIAVVNGVELATAAVTYTLPGGKVVISDAISGDAVEVVIWTWPVKTYQPQASVFRVGGRNLVVSGDLGQYTTQLELYVETDTARDNVLALLAATTEGLFLIRQPGGYNGVDAYYGYTGVVDVRMSEDQADERHLITVDVVQVEAWAPDLQARGFTYADLAAAYAGLTYADLAGDYATYLQLAQADLS